MYKNINVNATQRNSKSAVSVVAFPDMITLSGSSVAANEAKSAERALPVAAIAMMKTTGIHSTPSTAFTVNSIRGESDPVSFIATAPIKGNPVPYTGGCLSSHFSTVPAEQIEKSFPFEIIRAILCISYST